MDSDILRGKIAHEGEPKERTDVGQAQYSSTSPLETHFPHRREVWGWEGGCLFACEQAGVYYLFVDERTLADFLQESNPVDASVLCQLVTVFEFDTEDERRDHLNDLVLQALGYHLVQETGEEKTYMAQSSDHRVTLPRATEITKEMARSIQRARRSRAS